eukprot:1159761-Pelagomonas_calceolata.AAC.15
MAWHATCRGRVLQRSGKLPWLPCQSMTMPLKGRPVKAEKTLSARDDASSRKKDRIGQDAGLAVPYKEEPERSERVLLRVHILERLLTVDTAIPPSTCY